MGTTLPTPRALAAGGHTAASPGGASDAAVPDPQPDKATVWRQDARAHGRTAVVQGASNTGRTTAVPAERTVVIAVEVTVAEAEALRDGAFTCTSPDPRRYQAGRRALLALRAAARASDL